MQCPQIFRLSPLLHGQAELSNISNSNPDFSLKLILVKQFSTTKAQHISSSLFNKLILVSFLHPEKILYQILRPEFNLMPFPQQFHKISRTFWNN